MMEDHQRDSTKFVRNVCRLGSIMLCERLIHRFPKDCFT